MQELAENVVISTEFRRINVGAIATGTGVVCIDVPPIPREARYWRALLLEHFKQPIRLLILTDANRDRLLGAHWFEEARVIAHTSVYDAIKTLPNTFVDHAAEAIAENSDERISFSGVHLRLPSVTYSERMTAYVDDFPVPLIAMPGPTPGNTWIHLPDIGVVFTGDSVIVDQPLQMGQMQSKSWLNSLTMLRRPRFAAKVIVSGRGRLAKKRDTEKISDRLRYMRRRVQRLYRAGRPRSDIAEIVPSVIEQVAPRTDDDDLPRRMKIGLESIYDELRREAKGKED